MEYTEEELELRTAQRVYDEVLEQRQDEEGHRTPTTIEQVKLYI